MTITVLWLDSEALREKSLAELGVQPGWFCRHGGCSIWFEILRVHAGAVLCVARDPAKQTEHVFHYSGWSGLWEVADGKPPGSHWIDRARRKNFFDKFFPERDKIVPN